jgi:hypothetical protein
VLIEKGRGAAHRDAPGSTGQPGWIEVEKRGLQAREN